MKLLLIALMMTAFAVAGMAQDVVVAPGADAAASLTKAVTEAPAANLNLAGKIEKEMAKIEGADAKFTLVTKEGLKIALTATKDQLADLDKLVGKEVKVAAKGVEKMEGDKKVVKVDSIVKVEEAPAAPAETK